MQSVHIDWSFVASVIPDSLIIQIERRVSLLLRPNFEGALSFRRSFIIRNQCTAFDPVRMLMFTHLSLSTTTVLFIVPYLHKSRLDAWFHESGEPQAPYLVQAFGDCQIYQQHLSRSYLERPELNNSYRITMVGFMLLALLNLVFMYACWTDPEFVLAVRKVSASMFRNLKDALQRTFVALKILKGELPEVPNSAAVEDPATDTPLVQRRTHLMLQAWTLTRHETLPTELLASSNGTEHEEVPDPNENPCGICLQPYQNKDKMAELPCSHQFHKTCIERRLDTDMSCCYCRAQFEWSLLFKSKWDMPSLVGSDMVGTED